MTPEAIEVSVLIVTLVVAFILFTLAYYFKEVALGYISGFLFTIIGIHIVINGFATTNSPLIFSFAIILVGFGITILWKSVVEDLDMASTGKKED